MPGGHSAPGYFFALRPQDIHNCPHVNLIQFKIVYVNQLWSNFNCYNVFLIYFRVTMLGGHSARKAV